MTLFGVFAIAIGAILGAVSRYYLTEFFQSAIGRGFPSGTFIINLTGCLLMGFFFTLFQEIPGIPLEIDLFVKTGFLGSYTTFSTYGYDTLLLWQNARSRAALLYWIGSATLGVIAIIAGRFLAQLIVKYSFSFNY